MRGASANTELRESARRARLSACGASMVRQTGPGRHCNVRDRTASCRAEPLSLFVGNATRGFSKAGFRGGHPAKRGELRFLPVDQGIAVERADLNKWCTHAPTRGSQRARDRACTSLGSITSATSGRPTTPMRLLLVAVVCSRSDAVPSFSAVEAVRPRRTVLLRLDHRARESSPLAERRRSGHGHFVLWALLVRESGAELGVRFQKENP
jgi:hypothetical protein